MRAVLQRLLRVQQSGLVIVALAIGVLLTSFAGSHVDSVSGQHVNNFLNSRTIMQTATDTCFFAIMAIGVTMVIITAGIDLSIGSIYALAGVTMAMVMRSMGPMDSVPAVLFALALCLGIGIFCGLLNGIMVVFLKVHPFIITLGTMWIFRGIAFIASKAESILLPNNLTAVTKATLGLGTSIYPVPLICMIVAAIIGEIYLLKTVSGRNIYAVGGNLEAARYCGIRSDKVLVTVFVLSGLTAGIAAFLGCSFYGSASCADATGYELYVIASAVVGGASLVGGKGSAIGATLGALLIVLIRQSINTLHFDQNYEWIIIGCAIIIAVVLDRINAQLAVKRMVRQAEEKETTAASV